MKIDVLNRFWINVVSIYLVVFDVVTDIVLIYNWIKLGNYTWASLQILFILSGQLVGTFGCYNIDNDKQDKLERNLLDKLMSLIGFGRAWFIISSWSDRSSNENYRKLYKKHKIYELMYESFPSVTLQLYATFVSDQISVSIIQCILATFVSMSWNVWIYLVGITRSLIYKNKEANSETVHASSNVKSSNAESLDCKIKDNEQFEQKTIMTNESSMMKYLQTKQEIQDNIKRDSSSKTEDVAELAIESDNNASMDNVFHLQQHLI